ncbi:MAG: serine/threonine protein kinase [Planctomyces sp.]|nr:serine/threonine protein kinase [Planctomyces sp.]
MLCGFVFFDMLLPNQMQPLFYLERAMNEEHDTVMQDIIQFTRVRKYQFAKKLGSGACGETVLLHDDILNEHFVCKKYKPISESLRQELFDGFVREIKILHKLLHPHVVRIFNYYLYPASLSGYIIMEHVDGQTIDKYISQNPESINAVFTQTVAGFKYLHNSKILHRDIRPSNIMVTSDGVTKIIDLGFGKEVFGREDLVKSVSLNWCFDTPKEFSAEIYDFSTEVYFVGKLFEKLIKDNNISEFQHTNVLAKMCQPDPINRFSDFSQVVEYSSRTPQTEISFSPEDLRVYKLMADEIVQHLVHIKGDPHYTDDLVKLQSQLRSSYHKIMLETVAPDCGEILQCFVDANFRYRPKDFSVDVVKNFLDLLSRCNGERASVLLANIHNRLNTIKRVDHSSDEDDVPF